MMAMMPRRRLVKAALATATAPILSRRGRGLAAPVEIKLPDGGSTRTFDFETQGIEEWTTVGGQWEVEEMPGAPSGTKVLVQRTTKNPNVLCCAGERARRQLRLYAYNRGRRQIASASVTAPALGRWHTVRLVAVDDHIQGWLDGALYLDHRDSQFKSGRVGLWTKADSITAFDDLRILGRIGGG